MTYILLLVFSLSIYTPTSIQLSEFKTKESCEIALKEANKFYKTVEKQSKCISVEDELKKQNLQKEIDNLKKKL